MNQINKPMDVIIAQVISTICLFVLTTCSGLIPIVLVNKLRARRIANSEPQHLEKELNSKHGLILSCLLNFGGGVLLSTCFVHMVPEVREMFMKGFTKQGKDAPKFPVIESVLCLGFFFVYLVEEIISSLLGHKTHSHFNSTAHDHSPVVVQCDNIERNDAISVPSQEKDRLFTSSAATTSYGTDPPRKHTDNSNQTTSGLKGLMIIVALSFHAIFEGMSIGLQPEPILVWSLFFGISIHKVVLAFCVGLETYLHGTRQMLVIIYMVVFASMTPIGAGIGAIVNSILASSMSVLAVLQAVAAGTIMYVTFFEVFFQEKNSQQPGLLKLLSAFIGFIVMSSLTLLE